MRKWEWKRLRNLLKQVKITVLCWRQNLEVERWTQETLIYCQASCLEKMIWLYPWFSASSTFEGWHHTPIRISSRCRVSLAHGQSCASPAWPWSEPPGRLVKKVCWGSTTRVSDSLGLGWDWYCWCWFRWSGGPWLRNGSSPSTWQVKILRFRRCKQPSLGHTVSNRTLQPKPRAPHTCL